MTPRFAHIRQLVTLRQVIARNPDAVDGLMRAAIVTALPDQYRKVYDWIGTCYSPVTSAMVMRVWDLNHNHASTLLKELWDFGLLERTQRLDENGRTFVYKYAP